MNSRSPDAPYVAFARGGAASGTGTGGSAAPRTELRSIICDFRVDPRISIPLELLPDKMVQGSSTAVASFVKGLYYDDFKWSVVKSIGLFALGVTLAKECQGMELFVPSP